MRLNIKELASSLVFAKSMLSSIISIKLLPPQHHALTDPSAHQGRDHNALVAVVVVGVAAYSLVYYTVAVVAYWHLAIFVVVEHRR